MTLQSFPFDGQATTETQYSKLFRELQDNGVADSIGGSGLKASASGTGMGITLQPGFAMVRGFAMLLDATYTVTPTAADSSARIDRVVLRLDPTANSVTPAVLKGTAGSSNPPALTQTDTGIWEEPVALVNVGASAANLLTTDVTDDRRYLGTRIRAWQTTTRPANPRKSQLGLNTTTSTWEFYDGTTWQPLAPTVTWSTIQGAPTTFTPAPHHHDWNEIDNKPSSFTPSAHQHGMADLPEMTNYVNSGLNGKAAAQHRHVANDVDANGGQTVQWRIDDLYNTKAVWNHGHSFANNADWATNCNHSTWTEGSVRVNQVAIGGGGQWYSAWVDGNGYFCHNTSSRRYKKNIRDAGIQAADVLALRPVVYDRKDDVHPGTGEPREGRKGEFGLIAEEVYETLPQIVALDGDQVEAVNYELLSVALLAVVKDQESRLRALEAKIT